MNIIKKSIFIDGSFIYHSTNRHGKRLDFSKIVDILIGNDYLVNFDYYSAVPEHPDGKHVTFLKMLSQNNIRLKSVPLKKTSSDLAYSKGEDMLLACCMLKGACFSYYDEAILFTGDGDFVPLVEQVRDLGKKVTLITFKSSSSNMLISAANSVLYLEDIPELFTSTS